MKEYYYCLDGQTVDGPHSELEIKELRDNGTLPLQALVCAAGEKEWVALEKIQFSTSSVVLKKHETQPLTSEASISVDHKAVAEAGSDLDEEAAEEEDRGPGKYQLIKAIRADLDLLWKAQRESLISHIRGLELDPDYETTRKQAKDIKERIKNAALLY